MPIYKIVTSYAALILISSFTTLASAQSFNMCQAGLSALTRIENLGNSVIGYSARSCHGSFAPATPPTKAGKTRQFDVGFLTYLGDNSQIQRAYIGVLRNMAKKAIKLKESAPSCAYPCHAIYAPIEYITTQPTSHRNSSSCSKSFTFSPFHQKFDAYGANCEKQLQELSSKWVFETMVNPYRPSAPVTRAGMKVKTQCPQGCSLYFTQSYQDLPAAGGCQRDYYMSVQCQAQATKRQYAVDGYVQPRWECK